MSIEYWYVSFISTYQYSIDISVFTWYNNTNIIGGAYVNRQICQQKTGAVSIYESTSHYDPVTKQSRPIRKYLGREDPETGELIPSSGKRGRKPKSQGESSESDALVNSLRLQINDLKKEITQQEKVIHSLQRKNQELLDGFQSMAELIHRILNSVNLTK